MNEQEKEAYSKKVERKLDTLDLLEQMDFFESKTFEGIRITRVMHGWLVSEYDTSKLTWGNSVFVPDGRYQYEGLEEILDEILQELKFIREKM
jgi:hypothetical protein